jgi:hypothetical protein
MLFWCFSCGDDDDDDDADADNNSSNSNKFVIYMLFCDLLQNWTFKFRLPAMSVYKQILVLYTEG